MHLNLGLAIADDLTTVADGLRSVTLRTDRDVLTDGFSVELRTSEIAASGGRYLAGDTRFHVQANALAGARPPRPGDTLTDDGADLAILEATRATLSTRYAMVCRRIEIAGSCRTKINLQRALYKTGSTGAREVESWETIRAAVTAWIVPKARANEMETGQRLLKPVFTIYLALPDMRPESHWRVLADDGKAYRIETVSGEQRLDQLVEMTAEEHRWV